ncbi:MAG: DUF1353 domain-containing protein [Pseudomonadota bacterium]
MIDIDPTEPITSPLPLPQLHRVEGFTRGSRPLFATTDPVCYKIQGKIGEEQFLLRVYIPQGFLTDLASIPQAGRLIVRPTRYAEAAIIHDFLYALAIPGKRKRADQYFRVALMQSGITPGEAFNVYQVVRKFGGKGYGRRIEASHLWDKDTDAAIEVLPVRLFPDPDSSERTEFELAWAPITGHQRKSPRLKGEQLDNYYITRVLKAYGIRTTSSFPRLADPESEYYFVSKQDFEALEAACPNAITLLEHPEFIQMLR